MGGDANASTLRLTEPVPKVLEEDAYFKKVGVDMTFTRNWPITIQSESHPNDNTLRFNLPKMSQGNYYLFQDMKLRQTMVLRDKDGQPLTKNDFVAGVNNLGPSMWQDLRLFLNNTQVSAGSSGLYPLQSHVHHLLNFGTDKQQGFLGMQGFFKSTEADWDPYFTSETSSFRLRRQLFGKYDKNNIFQYYAADHHATPLISPIHTDFSTSERPMVSNVGGRLEITRSPNDFCLVWESESASLTEQERQMLEDDPPARTFATVKPQLIIKTVELVIPVLTLAPSLDLRIEDKMAKHALLFNTMRMSMSKYALAKDQQAFSFEDLKQSQISPDRMFLMVVPDYRLNGTNGEDPFQYSNCIEAADDKTHEHAAFIDSMRLSINNESLESYETNTYPETLIRKYYELNGKHLCDYFLFDIRRNVCNTFVKAVAFINFGCVVCEAAALQTLGQQLGGGSRCVPAQSVLGEGFGEQAHVDGGQGHDEDGRRSRFVLIERFPQNGELFE